LPWVTIVRFLVPPEETDLPGVGHGAGNSVLCEGCYAPACQSNLSRVERQSAVEIVAIGGGESDKPVMLAIALYEHLQPGDRCR
jgi:hypothetical protein